MEQTSLSYVSAYPGSSPQDSWQAPGATLGYRQCSCLDIREWLETPIVLKGSGDSLQEEEDASLVQSSGSFRDVGGREQCPPMCLLVRLWVVS